MSKAVKGVGSVIKGAAFGPLGISSQKKGFSSLLSSAGIKDPTGMLGSNDGGEIKIPNTGLSASQSRSQRAADFAQGLSFGKQVIPPGVLGRLTEEPDIQKALDVRREQLSGLTGQEMQASRDVALQRIGATTEGARRRLAAAQARSGVRGATAASQQAGVIGQGIDAARGFERDLLLRNRAEQSSAAGALLKDTKDIRSFDLDRAARERLAQLQAGFGFQQLGVTERAGVAAQQATIAAAKAQAPSGGLLGGLTGK